MQDKTNIPNDSENRDTQLPGMDRRMPFEIPPGYFDKLPGAVTAKASRINSGDLMQPYGAPEGYFDTLPDAILARVSDTVSHKERPPVRIRLRAWRWAAAAALFIGAAAGLYRLALPGAEHFSLRDQLATLPQSDLNDYVVAHIDEFETGELAELAYSGSLPGTGGIPAGQIPHEDILDYLDATGWDKNF